MEAIVGGYHGDPFRILGPHSISEGKAKTAVWTVVTFQPQAASVEILPGVSTGSKTTSKPPAPQPMDRVHPHGIFIHKGNATPGNYRFRITDYSGNATEVEDPYRFPPLMSDFDIHLHGEGTDSETYNKMGSHLAEVEGVTGVRFTVWAPNAEVVFVVGDFNDWDPRRNPMRLRNGGIWEIFIPNVGTGTSYKYFVKSKYHGYQQLKADPYGYYMEVPPKSASIVWDIDAYEWNDAAWLEERGRKDWLKEPISLYEVHLESWMRDPEGNPLTYRELARTLIPYVKQMGFTHIELLPIAEHPFSGSWGYQVVGYFAPTARFGTPDDFMYFVDQCHQNGIGVYVDWVPGHFPKDAHGLAYFDGTHLYEHSDPRLGEHRDWGTLIFNYGRNEVKTFLVSNALFWLKKYHIDGLRVDAVASMLYLDYSRKAGEWIPNRYGGNENLEALEVLRRFNELAHQVPGAVTAAEESTAFPGISRPVYLGGVGFTFKWNMGWMHDMLAYFERDPIFRKFHQNNITFSMLYAFSENFILPISHDEVVHGKRSLMGKMPGDEWQRFANARAFFAYMWTHPGKKLIFMGSDVGQYEEWDSSRSVRWELLQWGYHRGLQSTLRRLNELYRSEKALHQVEFHWSGFEWIDINDVESSVITFLRRAEDRNDFLVVLCNFTPAVRHGYSVGVPEGGIYAEIFNSDATEFGGSGVSNGDYLEARPQPMHGRPFSVTVTLPPLGVAVLKRRP
ncbi:MAG: 1,4-alpha-glucan branching protein GlgB [Bryobacterales bacterium]|nr:1,4-alpha-glucan branching protein GlgB [Bryobacterales bacterium]